MTIYYNSLLLLSLIAFYGAVIYRVYELNYAGIFLTLIFTIITFILLNKRKNSNSLDDTDEFKLNIKNLKFSSILLLASYSLLIIINFVLLFKASTASSIISPWQVIPWYFWLTFTLTTLILIITILKTKLPNLLYFILYTLYFILVFSIAIIIYKIGFGFDPFIHEATIKLIAEQGAVYPKPFYYLGQYSLIIVLHKILFIPISILNTWLVPILASIFLPPTLFYAVKKFTEENKTALLTTLFILILPFSIFIITTPQNLANLFLILLILLSLRGAEAMKQSRQNIIIMSLALATLAIHPISGIPAVLFATILLAKKYIQSKKLLVTCYLLLVVASTLALPFAFYLNNKTSNVINSTDATTNVVTWHLPTLFLSGQENFLLNFVYLYGFNIAIIIALFIFTGIFLKIRGNNLTMKQFNNEAIYLLMSSSLIISYAIVKTMNFSYLINYEQSNFSNRILLIAVFFTLPFILLALSQLVSAILKQEKIIKYSLICFFIFLLSCSLYISYPRYDNYHNSRSFSTSKSDINAVRWINENAGDNDFIVLANQQVSAAALREFGFKKYYSIPPSPYQGEGRGEVKIFYYPIPTGDKLYQYYLDMVYPERKNPPQADASRRARKTAIEAAELVNVNTVYFVLNDYWWAFDKILAEAKLEADEVKSIDDCEVFIFKYVK